MDALVCDICGGRLIGKEGGIFACTNCGMEYSVERIKEKVQEVQGTVTISGPVQVDNSHLVNNYLEMAENAQDNSNNSEAEQYCNKIIETDPKNYKAWLIKGKAAGWQSTLANSRFPEAVSAFSKAIEFSPDEDRPYVIDEAKEEIKNLSLALLSLRCERFEKWPDKDESDGFLLDLNTIFNACAQFISTSLICIDISEITGPSATKITSSIISAYNNKILPDYKGDENRPSDYDFKEYLNRIDNCIVLLERVINLCDDDDESDIKRYENLIQFQEFACDACSWDWDYVGDRKYWSKKLVLTDAAKNVRRGKIAEYRKGINDINDKKAQRKKEIEDTKNNVKSNLSKKTNEKYWQSHSAERDSLLNEKKSLEEQINPLKAELPQIVEETRQELMVIDNKIGILKSEKESLGLFKTKEKADIQSKIDVLIKERQQVETDSQEARKPFDQKIKVLTDRINEIDSKINPTNNECIINTTPNKILEVLSTCLSENLALGSSASTPDGHYKVEEDGKKYDLTLVNKNDGEPTGAKVWVNVYSSGLDSFVSEIEIEYDDASRYTALKMCKTLLSELLGNEFDESNLEEYMGDQKAESEILGDIGYCYWTTSVELPIINVKVNRSHVTIY